MRMQVSKVKAIAIAIVLGPATWMLASFGCAAVAADTCNFARPPKEAGLNVNHGEFFFIYPAKLEPGFTGCQTMWDERGQKTWVGHYDKGVPSELQIADGSPRKMITCRYRDGKLEAGTTEACPSAGALRRGLGSVSEATAPPVPPERDPRVR